jgi:hypothetical protein
MVKRLFTMKTTSARFTMHTWKKKGASGLDAATVDVEAVQIFLMETFVMLALPLPAGMKDADVIWPGMRV